MTRLTIVQAGIAGLALTAAGAISAPAGAEVLTYNLTLTSSAEVPANDSAGSGKATVTFDTATKKLTWEGSYTGLTGPETAAHFHGPAEPGKNASVVVPFTATSSPFKGSADLTDAQAADLLAGKWYMNVHTEAHKGGEIRAQVVK
jgi:CHRD domain